MNKLFKEDTIRKEYLAIVQGRTPGKRGSLEHWLIKDQKKNITKAYREKTQNAKKAVLDYELMGNEGTLSLVKVFPKTGRPHQIRVQLSSIGCPIQGDLKYGFTSPNPDKSISLHAFAISFVHPVNKKEIRVKSHPGWQHFKQIVNELD